MGLNLLPSRRRHKRVSFKKIFLQRFITLSVAAVSFLLSFHYAPQFLGYNMEIHQPEVVSPEKLPQEEVIARLMKANDCSYEGFGPNVVPAGAVVLKEGKVELTTFAEGWAIYKGQKSGTLIAPCLYYTLEPSKVVEN